MFDIKYVAKAKKIFKNPAWIQGILIHNYDWLYHLATRL